MMVFFKKERWGLLVLFLTWLVFFSRLLSGLYVYYLDDLKIFYYPLETLYAQFQQAWQLPLWTPLFGFGHPLLAWGQLGFLNPVHVLTRALLIDPLDLLQLSVMAYFAAGLLGMYCWLRRHRLSPAAAVLGAIVFTFCGFSIGHLNHVNFYTGTMILPWLLLTLDHFILKPRLRTMAILVLISALIPLSAQPQLTMYVFMIAALYGLIAAVGRLRHERLFYWIKLLVLSLVFVALSVSVASLAILPLSEFLPMTERSDALPESELFDFSYAPWHAVTLVVPYFYGDHRHYWGAKGFQELAAFVGIIPLLLVGPALVMWPRFSRLRVLGMLLVAVGIIFALGEFSGIYTYLVLHKILTSFSVPGRFVLFFDVGIAVLAAVGLDDLRALSHAREWRRIASIVLSLSFIALLFTPFFVHMPKDLRMYDTWNALLETSRAYVVLVAVGAAAWLVAIIGSRWPRSLPYTRTILLMLTAITVIAYSWNYNPVMRRADARQASPFTQDLRDYTQRTGLPPRLYSTNMPLSLPAQIRMRKSDAISPIHAVYQPITPQYEDLSCLTIPIAQDDTTRGDLTVAIGESLFSQPLRTITITPQQLVTDSQLHTCFEPIPHSEGHPLILTLKSTLNSGVHVFFEPSSRESGVYIVRRTHPTTEQVAASQKELAVLWQQDYSAFADEENAILARHLQSLAGSSSARWIGALSIRPYREFIETFFANDRDPVDGDGRNPLLVNRRLVDMTGITHIIEPILPSAMRDPLPDGFVTIREVPIGNHVYRLYENIQAFPKTFMVPQAILQPAADEVRAGLILHPDQDMRQVVYIDGPTPPRKLPSASATPLNATTTITRYENTRVDVAVATPRDAWLVLTDAATPQWQTYIDDQPTDRFTANSIFRAALVLQGQHTVSFRYYSPATQKAKILTLFGLAGTLLCFVIPTLTKRYRRAM